MNNTSYSTGTVSVAANGTAVTGVGTAWQAYGVRPGDLIVIDGVVAIIGAVGSNTALTLAAPWPGGAKAARPYFALLLDDRVRGQIATLDLVQLLGNGTLQSLAAQAGAADRLPYLTGPNTMALTPLTSAARGLLDDADVAAMRATLELVKQPSATDGVNAVTDARVVRMDGAKTAALARGGTNHQSLGAAVDIDALPAGAHGLYHSGANSGTFPPFGTPTSGFWAISTDAVFTSSLTSAMIVQTAVGYRSGTASPDSVVVCQRVQSAVGANWTSWVRLYHNRNIVGAVAQSGGVPTGAIIERGSNPNGEFAKLADGTMICTLMTSVTDQAIDTAYGSLFLGARTWTFPASFAVLPSVACGTFRYGTGASWPSGTLGHATTTAVILRGMDVAARLGGSTTQIAATAIGRWY